jgi:hypothetical protein
MTISVAVLASVSSRTLECIAKSGAVPAADIRAAKALRAGRYEDIRKSGPKEAKMQFETPVEKLARSQRVQKSLAQAIDDYARGHRVSKAHAADKVLLSATTSEYVRLDKALASEQRQAVVDRDYIDKAAAAAPWGGMNRTGSYSAPDDKRRPTLPGATVKSSDEILNELADKAMARDPSLSRAQAINAASMSPSFTAALNDERAAKLVEMGAIYGVNGPTGTGTQR